jgi:hypothetical protein
MLKEKKLQPARHQEKKAGREYKMKPRPTAEDKNIAVVVNCKARWRLSLAVTAGRAFVKMCRELLADSTLEVRLEKIEKTLLTHDIGLRDLYQKLKPLLLPPPEKPTRRRIGFHAEEEQLQQR